MSALAAKSKIDEFRSFDEILGLIGRFEDRTLPKVHWNHRAHLTVACWYLICHSEPEATIKVRTGIKRYNESQGTITTKESGYHETLTIFWIRMVHRFLAKNTLECSIVPMINEMVRQYSIKSLPFEYYSRERLMSWEARTSWLEPDLKPLE